jgi:hypothetical protein
LFILFSKLVLKIILIGESNMQFFIYFTIKEGEPMTPPSPEGMAKMGKVMQESFESGKIVATGQLPQETTQVKLEKGKFSITDGPFIEGKELIPGFTIINVDSKQEAIEWAKELRECMGDGILKMAQLSATSAEDL